MKFTHLACTGLALAIATTSVVGLLVRPAEAQVANSRRALNQSVRELNVEGSALSKTLDYLRDISSANIVVNWKVLESVGVAKETPITINVRELTLRKMLQLVLDQASPNAALVYSIDGNVIQITTQEDADKQMITKVYVVDDLIMVPANRQPPTLSLGLTSSSGTGGGGSGGFGDQGNSGGGGSNGGGLFGNQNGNSGNTNNTNSTTPTKTAQQRGDDLVALIREVVRPNIWKENGGTASIKFFGGKLIVTAPISVHEAIGGPVESGMRFGN